VLPELPAANETLTKFDLASGKYVLLVSRLVPEKRHLDLIAAFQLAQLADWKLVIVGGADHPDTYQREVIDQAAAAGVVMTGFQRGLALQTLYAHAGLFVLPSSHEGLPIAMLEALSYGLPVLASDIPANLEVGLSATNYFPLGDIAAMSKHIQQLTQTPLNMTAREEIRTWVTQRYNWHDIANKTLAVYNHCLDKNHKETT
jgi:glycosyltransferase involved in cell wall biosynthesis